MAFESFAYSKSWEKPEDFPTYEPDESRVRADLQLLHDEAKDAINRLIDALNDSSAAAQLPFAPVGHLTAQTVQEAIEQVYAAVKDAAAGQIVVGSVTKEKLEEALLQRIYGGRMWVSMDAPTEAQNPDTDFPVGQLWLRPGVTIKNLAGDDWEVSGGSAAREGDGWVFTADGTEEFLTASLAAQAVGTAGQQVMICLKLAQSSGQEELYIEDLPQTLDGSGCFEANLDQTGSLEVTLHIPAVESGDTLELAWITVVNTDALEAQQPHCRPCSDWQTYLEGLEAFAEAELPRTIWLQTGAGKWEEVISRVLPVQRGGTGLASVEAGALLYGTGTDTLAALPPVHDGILQWSEGQPRWVEPGELAQKSSYLRTMEGTYTGDGGAAERTLTLPVAPMLLFIWSETGDTRAVADGGRASEQYSALNSSGAMITYSAWVALDADTLTFRHGDEWPSAEKHSRFMNEKDVLYHWRALY